MKFALLETLQAINEHSNKTATTILETADHHPNGRLIVERADVVLGQLVAKLSSGQKMSPGEVDEYAAVYASLQMLAQADVRAGFNIDTSTPDGKLKFARMISNVGDDPYMTDNVKRVSIVNGQSRLRQVKSELEAFPGLDDTKKQVFLNQVNKLRIGYERARNQLAPQIQAQPAPQAAPTGEKVGP